MRMNLRRSWTELCLLPLLFSHFRCNSCFFNVFLSLLPTAAVTKHSNLAPLTKINRRLFAITCISCARHERRAIMRSVMKSFREVLSNATNILILTGSGISAESGVPTFRGAGGFWRKYQAQNLATPEAFAANPSLVWEFYEYRRQLVSKVKPNKAHEAVAEFQKRKMAEGKAVSIVTQNIDGLHQKAGAIDVVELHGSLYRTRCTKCHNIVFNDNIPICMALAGKGSPDPNIMSSDIPKEELPRCEITSCGALLRPDIVWFGEQLHNNVLRTALNAVETCDACLVIGTSAIVYPAAMFAPQVAQRNVPVAEFNVEETPATGQVQYHFQGRCTTTVVEALAS